MKSSATIAGLLLASLQADGARVVAARRMLLALDTVAAPHQVRVGLRRLRTSLRALRDSVGPATVAPLEGTAKRLAAAVGQLRDADVIIETLVANARRDLSSEAGWSDLLTALRAHREARRAAVRKRLEGRAWTTFETRLAVLASEVATRDDLATAARPIARNQLRRQWRQLRRRGKGMAALDAVARHELRIAVKRMRYLLALCAPLFDDREVKPLRKRLSALQAELGALSDAQLARRLVRYVTAQGGSPQARALARAIAKRQAVATDAAWQRARDLWQEVRRSEQFWR
jgi:triphosphatase